MILFPVKPKLFAPQQRFVPHHKNDERQAAIKNLPKAHQLCISLDGILGTLCCNHEVIERNDFPQLIAHVAFAQIRIYLQTKKDLNGTCFWTCPDVGVVTDKQMDRTKKSANAKLVRCLGPFLVNALNWKQDGVKAPMSAAVAFWFVFQNIRGILRKHQSQAVSSELLGVTSRVVSFLFDL